MLLSMFQICLHLAVWLLGEWFLSPGAAFDTMLQQTAIDPYYGRGTGQTTNVVPATCARSLVDLTKTKR